MTDEIWVKDAKIEKEIERLKAMSTEERNEIVADLKEKSDVLSKQVVTKLLRDGTFEKTMEKWENQTFEEHRIEGQKMLAETLELLSSGVLGAPTKERKELESALREIQKREMEKDAKTLEIEKLAWQEQLQRYRKIRDEA